MISHLETYKLTSFLNQFTNASLINKKGELLFSKDADPFKTTTSRLVLFQIVKKYLEFNVGDIFISNDPENGGTSLSRLFFISALSENLFLIWDAEQLLINFKIPLSPLLEKHKLNTLLWQALVDSSVYKSSFEIYFNKQINKYKSLFDFAFFIKQISQDSYQKQWFLITKSIFTEQFEAKALGEANTQTLIKDQFSIKLSFLIDDKQNQKTLKCDFSGTTLNYAIQENPSELTSCASHVVESGFIIEFIKFYNLEKYLSQPILDQIKLILPPKSIISTPHKKGSANFELQKTVRQMVKHLFQRINSIEKKKDQSLNLKLNLYSTYLAQVTVGEETTSFFLSNSRIQFDHFNFFTQTKLQNLDGEFKADLTYKLDQTAELSLYGIHSMYDSAKRWIKINNKPVHSGIFYLKKDDEISFNWKI